jgi:N-methylhydantoinase A
VLRPVNTNEVVEVVGRLIAKEEIEALAVSFLWSFLNPINERRAAEVIRANFPHVRLTSGLELHPVIREYERSTFALLNAATANGLVGIDALSSHLARLGLTVPILLVHSGGGSLSIDEARSLPVLLAESGPAAGVAAAAAVAREVGSRRAVTCDMGGTTFDLSVVRGGSPMRRSRGDVMGIWTAMTMVDVDSIGAGGGSIAWIDSIGALRVGPKSAGADPGPACYGKGGSEATLTDSLLVLGFIDADNFLGGEMPLDLEAAKAVCHRTGQALGLDALETAWGIREVALSDIVNAVRGRLAERGLDAREHDLLGFGGCAGLFTASIAAALGSPMVVIPSDASVLSALGAATLDVRRERSRSIGRTISGEAPILAAVCRELADLVDEDLANDGVMKSNREIAFEVDLRVRRQKSELTIPLRTEADDPKVLKLALDEFRREYVTRYGAGSLSMIAEVELALVRAIGVGVMESVPDRTRARAVVTGTRPPRSSKRLVQAVRSQQQLVDVVRAEDLGPGHALRGPVLVDGSDTTIWVPGNAAASVDTHGSLLVDPGYSARLP